MLEWRHDFKLALKRFKDANFDNWLNKKFWNFEVWEQKLLNALWWSHWTRWYIFEYLRLEHLLWEFNSSNNWFITHRQSPYNLNTLWDVITTFQTPVWIKEIYTDVTIGSISSKNSKYEKFNKQMSFGWSIYWWYLSTWKRTVDRHDLWNWIKKRIVSNYNWNLNDYLWWKMTKNTRIIAHWYNEMCKHIADKYFDCNIGSEVKKSFESNWKHSIKHQWFAMHFREI